MSAFNAWVMLKGTETRLVRANYQNNLAQRIAEYLKGYPAVRWVRYPYLTSHPQYDLAKPQMSGGGTVVTFELDAADNAARQRAFEVLHSLQLINISNGLGEGVVRISVGLAGTEDLIADIDRALG